MIIRPARASDFHALYGVPPKYTIRALTAEKDGTPVGIGGVAYIGNQVMAFSKFTDMTGREVARGALAVRNYIAGMDCPVLAIADHELETAPRLLTKLGFEHVASNSQGEVFRWRQRQH